MTQEPETHGTSGSNSYVPKIDRRTALAWIGVASVGGAAMVGAVGAMRRKPGAGVPAATGYGLDPDMNHPTAPWPRIMTPVQLQAAAHLCDFILPASGGHPSASGVGVPDFIDEWVSAPYPEQVADRALLLHGLDDLERNARRSGHGSLNALSPADRERLFQVLAQKRALKFPDPAKALIRRLSAPLYSGMFEGDAFLRRFRFLTIGAYYTTPAGFQDIGYVGNVALTSYAGPAPEVKALLDARLAELGHKVSTKPKP